MRGECKRADLGRRACWQTVLELTSQKKKNHPSVVVVGGDLNQAETPAAKSRLCPSAWGWL